ncbi:O-antigen polymerase [Acinetobacter sp. YH12126]|uniref:O-antigen polymerase n=1 Tax=Acinetobacter sp. YH12126 TaxID=2601111 RepID=UPI0015D40766|nr:O-antigen polymerase [Acinetobacter sp. YH12126]
MFRLFYFFSIIILFIIKPDKYSAFDYEYNFILGIYYSVIFLAFLLEQRLKDSNWLRFDVIFLLGYTIVHFQIPFLASLGIEPSNPSFVWLNKEVVNYSTWMSTLSIVIWIFAYSLISKRVILKNESDYLTINYKLYDNILIFVFVGFILTVGNNFLKGAYDVNSWGGGATYFLLILKVMIYLRIIYFFQDINKNISFKEILRKIISNKLFVTVLSAYTLLFFFTGSRGEVLRIALILAFSYSIFIKKISFKFILLSIVIGSIIFTLMGLGRGRDANELSDQNILQRGYAELKEKDTNINFTEELAYSVRIQYRAVDVVPDSHPYLYGVIYLPTIVSAIPFASGFFVKNFDIPDAYLDSANFFTYLGQGNNVTYGEGSEILADIYINFGLYGVFFIMFLFGAISAKVSNEAKNKRINYLLIYSILLMSAIAINRGTIFYFYKDIVYILFLHYFFSGKIKWLR